MARAAEDPTQETPHQWSAEEENLVAQLLRETLLGQANARAAAWKAFAWTVVVVLALSVVGNVLQGTRQRWTMYYVEIDKASKDARVIEPAAERYEPSVAIAQDVLSKAIKTIRGVGIDDEQRQEAWQDLRVCMTQKGLVQLKQYESREHPLAPQPPRKVEIVRILRQTARTYDLRWVEYQYNEKRELASTMSYGAILTFERRDPRTEAERRACPTGIFLDWWSLGKDQ
jgi:type IV secretory pathway TrbF-like protein